MNPLVEALERLGDSDFERAQNLVGVHPQSVARWRKGTTRPRWEDLENNLVLAEAAVRAAKQQAGRAAVETAA